jgi:4-hydroxy-2-oxoglutarate aldolase
MLLEGVFPAITTPFYPDGSVYLRKLEHNVERYSRSPVAGIVVLGSTGETVLLSLDEQREILSTAIAAAAAEKVMIAGVGQESVRHTLALAEDAARLQYDAVLVRTPHFYRPQMTPQAMLTYYRTVADSSPLPVILYSVPPFTNYELPSEVIGELVQHANIIGLKDSSGRAERIADVVAATRGVTRTVLVTSVFAAVTGRMRNPLASVGPSTFVSIGSLSGDGVATATAAPMPALKTRSREVGFQVLTGGAQTLHASLEAGAVGAVLGLAAPAPQCCYEVYTAWKEGDASLAAEKQQRITPAGTRVASRFGIPAIKYACDLNGYYGGRPRLPLLPLTAAERTEVETLMADVRY